MNSVLHSSGTPRITHKEVDGATASPLWVWEYIHKQHHCSNHNLINLSSRSGFLNFFLRQQFCPFKLHQHRHCPNNYQGGSQQPCSEVLTTLIACPLALQHKGVGTHFHTCSRKIRPVHKLLKLFVIVTVASNSPEKEHCNSILNTSSEVPTEAMKGCTESCWLSISNYSAVVQEKHITTHVLLKKVHASAS